jgi:hypothetical protein
MSNRAVAVFWLGLILIFLNFWISGQSTTLWDAITVAPPKNTTTPASNTTPTQTNFAEGKVAGANQTIVNVAGRGK